MIKIKCLKCKTVYSLSSKAQMLFCCGFFTPTSKKYLGLARRKNKDFKKHLSRGNQ